MTQKAISKIKNLIEEANALGRHEKAREMGILPTGNWQSKVKKQIKDDSMTAHKGSPETEPKVKTRFDNISKAASSFGDRVSPKREIGGAMYSSDKKADYMPTAIGSYGEVSMPENKNTNTFHTHPGKKVDSMQPSGADKQVLADKTKRLNQPVMDTVSSLYNNASGIGATSYSNTLKKDSSGEYVPKTSSVTYSPFAKETRNLNGQVIDPGEFARWTSSSTPNQQEWSKNVAKVYTNKQKELRDTGALLNGQVLDSRNKPLDIAIKPNQKLKDFYMGN